MRVYSIIFLEIANALCPTFDRVLLLGSARIAVSRKPPPLPEQLQLRGWRQLDSGSEKAISKPAPAPHAKHACTVASLDRSLKPLL
jgi:hypothetical protein